MTKERKLWIAFHIRNLAEDMRRVSSTLEEINEVHAKELRNASDMAWSWADEIQLEAYSGKDQ